MNPLNCSTQKKTRIKYEKQGTFRSCDFEREYCANKDLKTKPLNLPILSILKTLVRFHNFIKMRINAKCDFSKHKVIDLNVYVLFISSQQVLRQRSCNEFCKVVPKYFVLQSILILDMFVNDRHNADYIFRVVNWCETSKYMDNVSFAVKKKYEIQLEYRLL